MKTNMKNFNGGYIKASLEAYDLLVEAGYSAFNQFTSLADIIFKYYTIDNDLTIIGTTDDISSMDNFDYSEKQFYINNGALSWDEPTQLSATKGLDDLEILGEEMLSDGETTIEEIMNSEYKHINDPKHINNILSITDKDGKVYEFKKPDFECNLFEIHKGTIYGRANETVSKWQLNGKHLPPNGYNNYNLAPIQKKWYEDEANFPALVSYNSTDQGDLYCTAYGYENEFLYDELNKSIAHLNHLRLATKQERDSLYCSEE